MAIHSTAGGLGGKDLMETTQAFQPLKKVEPKIQTPKTEKIRPEPETLAPASKPTAQLLRRFESLPPVLHQALLDNQTLRNQFQEIEHLTSPMTLVKPSHQAGSLGSPEPIHENHQVLPLPQRSTSTNMGLSRIQTETVARNPVRGDNGPKIKIEEPERPVQPPRNDNGVKGSAIHPINLMGGKTKSKNTPLPKSLHEPPPQVPVGHLLDLKL